MPTYERAAVVQQEMAAQIVAELRSVAATDRFDNVLELGCGTGLLTRRLLDQCRLSRLILNDLAPECERTARLARRRTPNAIVRFMQGDMEALAFPDDQDLIVSSAVFQWATNPCDLLERVAGLLRPGGVLAMASFGPSNLREVSGLTGLSLRYWSVKKWREALAENYEVLSGSEDTRTLWFSSAHEVLRHLRHTGVNALDSEAWSPSKIRRFCRTYEATFGRNGGVPLTYHPVFIVARKRIDGGIRG
jgi:malonyl-ACP O-methyltransferase BioC